MAVAVYLRPAARLAATLWDKVGQESQQGAEDEKWAVQAGVVAEQQKEKKQPASSELIIYNLFVYLLVGIKSICLLAEANGQGQGWQSIAWSTNTTMLLFSNASLKQAVAL